MSKDADKPRNSTKRRETHMSSSNRIDDLRKVNESRLDDRSDRKGGKANTPTYRSWDAMVQRCTNSNHPSYTQYGGSGITVADEWLEFDRFLEDMGERPCPSYTLDRKDNSKGYSRDNCQWVSKKHQGRNRRSNRIIEYQGERRCLAEWAEINGISDGTLWSRLDHGWDIGEALTTPVHSRRPSGEVASKGSDAKHKSSAWPADNLVGWERGYLLQKKDGESRAEFRVSDACDRKPRPE